MEEFKVLEYKGKHKSRTLRRDVRFPVPKYFKYLSGLTVKELRDIAQSGKTCECSRYKKADLVRFINYHCVKRTYKSFFMWEYSCYVSDITHELVQKSVEKHMFQDSVRAWVGLFVSDESVSEHYAQVILDVLSPMSCFEEKSDTKYVICNLRDGKKILFRKPDPIVYDCESDEDLSDADWRIIRC